MSYYGSDKVVPHYNIMGFAMNRILDEKQTSCFPDSENHKETPE